MIYKTNFFFTEKDFRQHFWRESLVSGTPGDRHGRDGRDEPDDRGLRMDHNITIIFPGVKFDQALI